MKKKCFGLILSFLFLSISYFSLGQATLQFSFDQNINSGCISSGGNLTVVINITSSNEPASYEYEVWEDPNSYLGTLSSTSNHKTSGNITGISSTSSFFVKLIDKSDNSVAKQTTSQTFTVYQSPNKPTVSSPSSSICLSQAGIGSWDYKITNYDNSLTYSLYINIGNNTYSQVGSSNIIDNGSGNFTNEVNDQSAIGNSRTYIVRATGSSGCYTESDPITVNFKDNPITEKGTYSSPVDKYLLFSQTTYTIPGSDIFDNIPNSGVTWSSFSCLSCPTGSVSSSGVVQIKSFTSGTTIDSNNIIYTVKANGCTITDTLHHTQFEVVDDQATLPIFLRSYSSPICENSYYAYLTASINTSCLANPTGTINIALTYYNKTTKTSTVSNVTGYYAGTDNYSNNNLFNFYINPSLHQPDFTIPITITSANSSSSKCTPSVYSGKIPVSPINTASFSGLPDPIVENYYSYVHLCSASEDTVFLRANPSGGSYYFYRYYKQSNGYLYYDSSLPKSEIGFPSYQAPKDDSTLIKIIPSDLYKRLIKPKGNNYIIAIRYFSPSPCSDYITRYLTFDSTVTTSFTRAKDTICFGDTLNLQVTSGNNSGTDFFWDFGDGKSTGYVLNDTIEKHYYQQSGKYRLRFKTGFTSLPVGTCNNDVIDTISVGARPTAYFEVSRNFQNVNSTFHSKSIINDPDVSISGDTISEWKWRFENNILITAHQEDTTYLFGSYQKDPYGISHIVTTTMGCSDSITRYIPIFPIKSPDPSTPSLDTFNTADINGWYESGQYKIDTNSSWMNTQPNGNTIKGSSDAWFTWKNHLNGAGYYNNESSYIESPVYDLKDLKLPMVSLESWINTDNLFDGASVQYTFCDSVVFGEETWYTLGTINEGLNWYNSNTVIGKPGGNLKGWTNDTSTAWKLSAFRLSDIQDSIKINGHKLIQFRVVLGTNGDNTPGKTFDGFAFDNFYVGERNRRVIVEEFCDYQHYIPNIDSYFLDPQALRIQYHTSTFTSGDSINKQNPADPSARALYYGIGNALPRGVIDGIMEDNSKNFLTWGGDAFFKRSLMVAPFNISVSHTATDKLNISATIHKVNTSLQPKNYVVQIAVIERQVTGNGVIFTNVLRSMVPNAAGTRIDKSYDWSTDNTVSVEWNPFKAPESDYRVIAFLQDEDTKEIYQAGFDSIPANQASMLSVLKTGMKGSGGSVSINDAVLSPNPTSGDLMVSFNGITLNTYTITVLDGLGKVMKSQMVTSGTGGTIIYTDELSAGIYYLKIDGEGQTIIKKFSLVK